MEHLQKSYGGSTPLRDVNAVVRRGEVIAVIGPSGSGKSSLLRCLNRLETPTAGRITVLGRELTGGGAELAAVRQRMGMVFQSFQLFPHLTALENVTLAPIRLRGLPPQQAAARGMALLQAVGLGEKAHKYPGEMSGGRPSPAPWPWSPKSFCWTSPPPTSTPRRRGRCCRSSGGWPPRG